MAKKTKKKVDLSSEAPAGSLAHNPFAALGGLSAPEGEPAAAPAPAPLPEAPVGAAAEPASLGRLVLRREKKGRGGKTVTRVSGLPTDELAQWAKKMKKALGCGATVEGDGVLLLGDLEERAAEWLDAQGAQQVTQGTAPKKKSRR